MPSVATAALRCLTFRRFEPYATEAGPLAFGLGVLACFVAGLALQCALALGADGRIDGNGIVLALCLCAVLALVMRALMAGPFAWAMMAVTFWGYAFAALLLALPPLALTLAMRTGLVAGPELVLLFSALVWSAEAVIGLATLALPAMVVRSVDPFCWWRPLVVALALLAAGLATPLLAPLPTLLENAATDGAAD